MPQNKKPTMASNGKKLDAKSLDRNADVSVTALKSKYDNKMEIPTTKFIFNKLQTSLDVQKQALNKLNNILVSNDMKENIYAAHDHLTDKINELVRIERRKNLRFNIKLKCQISIQDKIFDAETLNICVGGIGIFVKSVDNLDVGMKIDLKLQKLGVLRCELKNFGSHGLNLQIIDSLNIVQRNFIASYLSDQYTREDLCSM